MTDPKKPRNYKAYDETADLAAAQAGSKDAIARLLLGCEPKVRQTLKSQFRRIDEHLGDIMQTTNLRVLKYFHGFRGDSTFNSWMTSIAINATKQVLAEVNLDTELCVSINVDNDDAGHQYHESNLTDPYRNNPEDIISDRQKIRLIEEFFKSSSPEMKTGLEMIIKHQLEDYSYQDLADEYNIPLGTVRSRMYRFREFAGHGLGTLCGLNAEDAQSRSVAGDYVPRQRDATLRQTQNYHQRTSGKKVPVPQ